MLERDLMHMQAVIHIKIVRLLLMVTITWLPSYQ